MSLTLMNGTTRRYFHADQGVEMLYGLEIDDFYNLIRFPPEQYWEFEQFLIHRIGRTQMWQSQRERRARSEMSAWAAIKEEWRIFLSRPAGRLLVILVFVLATFMLWVVGGAR